MKNRNKKICIFTGFALPHLGGVERYTDKIVEELKKIGYEITIVTSNHDNSKNYESLANYEIYRLPAFSLFKNRYPLLKKNKEYREIIKEINKKKFDAYICQTRFYSTSQIGAKIAKKNNMQPIIIEHGSNHLSVGNKVLDFLGALYEHFLTNKLKKFNPKFYGVSKRCNNWLKHFKIEACDVLYNSVDQDAYDIYKNSKYKEIYNNKIIITYVGRIIKEKGVELLLEAFNKLEKKYKIELVIAGDGPLLETYKEKYKSKKVHFEGKLSYDEVMSLLNQSSIFVHPSMYPEGLPTGILEAGIMKNAVIATDRGGTIEVIKEEKYGIIMEENENSLRKKLEFLLNDSKKIKYLQENLQSRVLEEFTWEVTAKKLVSILEKK
jgi:glycosyltransferase involved in cell wall biosynthesis